MPMRYSDFIKYAIVAFGVTVVLALLLAPYAGASSSSGRVPTSRHARASSSMR